MGFILILRLIRVSGISGEHENHADRFPFGRHDEFVALPNFKRNEKHRIQRRKAMKKSSPTPTSNTEKELMKTEPKNKIRPFLVSKRQSKRPVMTDAQWVAQNSKTGLRKMTASSMKNIFGNCSKGLARKADYKEGTEHGVFFDVSIQRVDKGHHRIGGLDAVRSFLQRRLCILRISAT